MAAKTKASTAIDPKLKIRLLLSLWDLGGMDKEVKQSELTNRVKLSKESNSVYQKVYDELEKKGAIAVSKKGRSVNVSLMPQGLEMLKSGLISADFQYRPQQRVRTKDFNALLNWIKHLESSAPASAVAEKIAFQPEQISSLEEFKKVALEVYERLNRDYNLDNLVPIYRIRREISDRVSRTKFNEWLLEMQAIDLIQLIGGEVTDITPDRAEDSITTKLGALRYYVQRLNA
ncbi:hypothetical protein [Oscillatoria sp. FACHB-1406]|uniref:hypothetical protein n=1 Tax=Oscillatoria sp. FACHB-1406 TaxID=2692846 RepID=UPI0016875443|nr:hypothetical protein [Oscillatoria sp. FACHB-1406]MBD2578708.1 hypothetical protein [Oscillatoria sp. FACHB-1406]